MSEESTAAIAANAQFERDTTQCLRNGPAPVQLVNSEPPAEPAIKPSQITADPGSTAPQPNVIRDILYAKAMDKTADMVDRRSAAEVLRLSFNERVEI